MAKKNSNSSKLDRSKHHIGDFKKNIQSSMEIPPQKPKTTNQDNSGGSNKSKK